MRLTAKQIQTIRHLVAQNTDGKGRVRVFGSRLDDNAHGGDLDLLLELPDAVNNPALISARLSARISRIMAGRKVDVVLLAPNLMRLPIHEVALKEGVLL